MLCVKQVKSASKSLFLAKSFICLKRLSSTIFALSSGHGKCGVAVIRISGTETRTALKQMTDLIDPIKPRMAMLRSIRHPETRQVLDKGLVLWFPGPNSFTGEDSGELQVHGGLAVVDSLLKALGKIPKMRLAEPGEFTRRAFYNGKLDLTEVEGLSDLLQAETELQRKQVGYHIYVESLAKRMCIVVRSYSGVPIQAFLQTQGALKKLYNKWREVLVRSVAYVEAHIDFEETEPLENDVLDRVKIDISELIAEIERHLNDGRKGEMLRSGVKTVIVGEPNVGKSSLFNLLCKRPAAIVTPIEGTTRDILEVTLNIGGYPLILTDTAGLRSKTKDVIEKEGISRAIQSYKSANLVILLVDAGKYIGWVKKNPELSFEDFLRHCIDSLNIDDRTSPELLTRNCVIVLNKIDLLDKPVTLNNAVSISCQSEVGINILVDIITAKLKELCGEPSEEHPSMNQARHKQHVTDCLTCLRMFFKQCETGDEVLMAEYLRKSLRHLGLLAGTTTTEQLLDVIFKDFCIGK